MAKGRKKAFDTTEALDAAMRVFWTYGYSSTSIGQLTEAMGINKPSLYATFGGKDALYKEALNHLGREFLQAELDILTNTEGDIDAICSMLLAVRDRLTDESLPLGCFVARSVSEAFNANQETRQVILTNMNVLEASLLHRLESAAKLGQSRPMIKASERAQMLVAFIVGLGTLASLSENHALVKSAVAGVIKELRHIYS
jgi:TetR/AcrR family transcriptional regulator, copper-responsive repressor